MLFTQLLWWRLQPTLFPLFLAAVMVSSWYGGLGPGLLSTALSTLLNAHFFLTPSGLLAIGWWNLARLIEFVIVALLITLLNSALRSAQHRAEKNAALAQSNYERLNQIQESLRQSEERHRLLVEGVVDYAIFMLDPKGHIVSWNIGAQGILGYRDVEILGKPFAVIFSPQAIQRGVPDRVLRGAAAEGVSRENRWHIRKDGTQLWAHCVITPLQDEDGTLRGFSKILQDITHRKQIEAERQQLLIREQTARAEAEASNRLKDQFLAILSHELRTPLTAILGWAEMLSSGTLDEARSAVALETIERNANVQMQLIQDLLDTSRIIRGQLSLNFSSVNLADVIMAATEVVRPAANAKGIQLKAVVDASVDPTWGDANRLQQVLWNLLSNAVKFTPEGGEVQVRLSRMTGNHRQPGSHYARIQVSDTGEGIPADFLPHIFEHFRQADSKSTRSTKGLGLGLAIARHLVELHGGTIAAASPGLGQGAVFTIKLPQQAISQAEARASNLDLAQGSQFEEESVGNPLMLAGLQVLVVEDEADARAWVRTVLEESGADVITAGSVDQALAAIAQFKPDVLVSDIAMPGEDGYGLIRKIRQLEPEVGGRIPAVALTAYASAEDYQKALAAGFQLHIAKPIRAAELIAVLADLAQSCPLE